MPTTTAYGTAGIADLLAANNTSIIDFGREDVYLAINEYFDATNALVNEQIDLFATKTTERTMGAGGPVAMTAHYTDEYGVPDSQKTGGPSILGLPMRKSAISLQWTYQWMNTHTPADMAAEVISAASGDIVKVQSALRTAFFSATNYTFTDRLVDNMAIPVKVLANADSFPIFPGPNGEVFDASTHSHYLGTTNAQPSPSDITALLLNVTEHRANGKLYLYVPQGVGNYIMANRVATYTDFAMATYEDQIYANNLTTAAARMNPINQADRMIGMYQGAEVWVKPWMPASVILAFLSGQVKPLAMRVPAYRGSNNGEFRPIFDDENLPLQSKVMERVFGFGVVNRTTAAVLSFAGGNTTYVVPTGL